MADDAPETEIEVLRRGEVILTDRLPAGWSIRSVPVAPDDRPEARTSRRATDVNQLWRCPSCGNEYKAAIPVLEVRCNNKHTRAGVAMALISGTLPEKRNPRRSK